MKKAKSVISAFAAAMFVFCLASFPSHGKAWEKRHSTPEASTTWNYTAMGDSLAVGYPNDFRGGYVINYRDYILTDTGNTVSLNNLGVNGWTSGELLNALRTNPNFRNSIRNM